MRPIVTVVLLVLLAAILAAPLLAEISGVAALPLYAAFSWICHQRPQRTWHLGGYPLAVCVRCLGLYAGALAGAIAGLPFFRRLFFCSMALFAVEWLAETLTLLTPPSLARFLVGLLAGFFLVPALWRNPEAPISVLRGGSEVRA